MVSTQKSVNDAALNLSGAKNGRAIGRTLNTVPNAAKQGSRYLTQDFFLD